MSVQILRDTEDGSKAMYCTTTDWAFGPIFGEDEEPDEFLDWLVTDPRKLTDPQLILKVAEWRCGQDK